MKHPRQLLNKETVQMIRQYAAQAEREGKLKNQQLYFIYQNRWFNLFVPQQYGGLELSKSELNRVWRDLHTDSQHTLLRFGS